MSVLYFINFWLWYLQNPPWDSGISPPELLEYIKTRPPGKALDMGCGTGTNAITLARLGWQVDGIDFIPGAIARARKKNAAAGTKAHFSLGSVTELRDFDGPYDFVLDLGCFHSLSASEMKAYLGQLNRVMKTGGTWFLYAFMLNRPEFHGDTTCSMEIPGFEMIGKHFDLTKRIDGLERGRRRSAYLIFEKINLAGKYK